MVRSRAVNPLRLTDYEHHRSWSVFLWAATAHRVRVSSMGERLRHVRAFVLGLLKDLASLFVPSQTISAVTSVVSSSKIIKNKHFLNSPSPVSSFVAKGRGWLSPLTLVLLAPALLFS